MRAYDAVIEVGERLGGALTDTQRHVAVGLLTEGHSLDVVVGIAGSGKTTTLSAVRAGFETAGHGVLGTATSGQAAKTLGQGAGIEARTIASLTWRLDQGTLALTDRHVVICDEAAMTADVDLGRLLAAVERAGAKMIVVGDDRQLDAVGPGGALTALAARHPDHVWTLTDNLRQVDPAERAALDQLRDGDLHQALAWYAGQGRIHPAPDQRRAVQAMAAAWAADVTAGKETLMLAYRRDHVEALNLAARRHWEAAGTLCGPELTAPGGRRYRAGDRIITLAPGPGGAWVTSQPATVTAVEVDHQRLAAVTPDGQQLRLGPPDITAERLAHGYAITAHRSQGSTVEVAHVLDDGGGRELAYVAMSRARHASHVYVTAPDCRQAAERLAFAWDQQRRQPWITDLPPAVDPIAELVAERDRLLATIPPAVNERLFRLHSQRLQVEQDRADLHAGAGQWAETAVGRAHRALREARQAHDQAVAQGPSLGLPGRRRARHAAAASAMILAQAETAWRQTIRPHLGHLDVVAARLGEQVRPLEVAQRTRAVFFQTHPEVTARIIQLEQAITQAQPTPALRPAIEPSLDPAAPTVHPDDYLAYLHTRQLTETIQPPQIHGPTISM